MAHETWLADRLPYLRALRAPSVTQKLLIELADKAERTPREQRELDALVKLERINDRAAQAKVRAHKILREKADSDRKARNHRLIVQGALIDLVGLESLDRGVLVGGLMQLARSLQEQGPDLAATLKVRGDARLAEREAAA